MKKEAEAASEANAKEAASRAAREAAAKAAAEAAEAAAEAAEASKAAEASSRKKEARLAAARQSASEELMAAMQAMDYGQRAGTDAELKRIRAAIQAARDSGMLLDDIAFYDADNSGLPVIDTSGWLELVCQHPHSMSWT